MNTQALLLLAALCSQRVLGQPGYDGERPTYHGLLAKPVVLKSGYLADTHEVAAAKTAHQAALEKLPHNNEANHDYTQKNRGYTEDNHVYNQDRQYNTPYHGPLAKPVVLKSGYLADTHEVAAAKTAHQAALEKLPHNNEANHDYTQKNRGYTEDNHVYNQDRQYNTPYHGPLTKPVVLKSGYLADTHEVAAAKTAHQAALEKLPHNNEANHDYTQKNRGYTEDNHVYNQDRQYNTPYHGALAKPEVLKSGYLADTHEVAAAKTAHQAALEKLPHNNEANHDYTQKNRGYTEDNHVYNQDRQYNTPYHGALAKPEVLNSGYLADTHEVAAAKTAHQAALEKLPHNNEANHDYTQKNRGYTEDNHVYNQDRQYNTPYHGALAKPEVLKSGYLADTHEVAAAKTAHQAALEKLSLNDEDNHGYTNSNQGYTQNNHGYIQNDHGYKQNNQEYNQDQHYNTPYHGPLAKPVVLKSGYLADTHEVAAAKTAHQAALEKLSLNDEDNHGYTNSNQGYTQNNHGYIQNDHGYKQNNQEYNQDQHYNTPYHGPLAKPVVLKSGYLADTHEVAAAKTAHQAALEKLSHNDEDNHGYTNNNQGYTQNNHGYIQNDHGYKQNNQEYNQDQHYNTPYHGPLAKPVVLKSGYLADTHEVAAAKTAHQAALEKLSHNNEDNHGYSQNNHGYKQNNQEYNQDQHYNTPYNGHLTKPVVLNSGYLADTHAVAAAKTTHQTALEKLSHNNEDNHGYTNNNQGYTQNNLGYTQNNPEYTKNNQGYTQNNQGYNQVQHYNLPYHGPLAKPVLLKSGYLADTHEVAAVKTAHQAALEKLSLSNEDKHGYSENHHGYTQNHQGYTENHHGYTQNHQGYARTSQGYTQNHQGYTENHQGHSEYKQYDTPCRGPLAKPLVLKSGYLADTHEVAAAKNAHQAALDKLPKSNEDNHGYALNNQEFTQNYQGYTHNPHNETPYHDVLTPKEPHMQGQHQPNYHGHYL